MEKLQENIVFDEKSKERYLEVMERLWSIHYSRFATLEIAESMKKEKRYDFYIEANENFNEEENRLWKYIEGEAERF